MNTLRARIAALLVAAIVAVVALSTLAAVSVLRGPRPEDMMDSVAQMIHVIVAAVQENKTLLPQQNITIDGNIPEGTIDANLTGFLLEALRRTGPEHEAFVKRTTDGQRLIASVRLPGDEWIDIQIPQFKPPPGQWKILAMWILLILAGSTVVSLYASSMITRPLRLVEKAANSIGSDAVIGPFPESGPGEVRATARALNRLSGRLKTAVESRMRLVAAAGHDLRTPMTRMRLRAEFITDDEQREKWLSDLAELDVIADSAIALVREEVGSSGTDMVRLDNLLEDIVDETQMLGLKAEMGKTMAVSVRAGPAALKRALRNLVVNAATHGEGATVQLFLSADDAIISIADNGPGIPEDQLDQIFEPFFRVDMSRRKTIPGAGLGMAIAREIIQRYGGDIVIKNRYGGGLLQQVVFPVAENRAAASDPSARSKQVQ